MKNSHLVRCPHSSVLTISISKFLKLPVFAAIALGGIQTSMAAQDINIGAGEILSPGLPGGGSGLVIETGTLTIAPTGRLNIQDNAVIVRTDNYAKIYGYLVTGYNFGAWDGFGISSSTAANDLQHLSGVGIIDNSEAHLPTFEGRSTPHPPSTNTWSHCVFSRPGWSSCSVRRRSPSMLHAWGTRPSSSPQPWRPSVPTVSTPPPSMLWPRPLG